MNWKQNSHAVCVNIRLCVEKKKLMKNIYKQVKCVFDCCMAEGMS